MGWWEDLTQGAADVWDNTIGVDGLGGLAGDAWDSLTGKDFKEAAERQAEAAGEARDVQRYIFDQSREDLTPWRESGINALNQLDMAMPEINRSFTMSDFTADPGYQFRMDEANKAIERSAAARGRLSSGRTLKDLTRFNQDYASNEYNNAFNRFNVDRQRRFNNLSTMAGLGQNSANSTVAANQAFGNNMANIAVGQGNAEAAAAMGMGNFYRDLVGQGIRGGMTAAFL